MLFPAAARAHAVEMLVLGHRLLRETRYETVAQGMFDLWMDGVVPHAVERAVGVIQDSCAGCIMGRPAKPPTWVYWRTWVFASHASQQK